MVRMRAAAVLALVACQGGSSEPAGGSAAGSARLDAAAIGSDAAIARDPDAPPKPEEPPEIPDPGKVIAGLGAIPAWESVVSRAQLLGRRNQHGVVFGRVGPAVVVKAPAPPASDGAGSGAGPGAAGFGSGSAAAGSAAPAAAPVLVDTKTPYVWLVDDTEGNGALGIRVLLGDVAAKAKAGDRAAIGGAWELDDEKRWYWKADSLQLLTPPPASDLTEAQPAVPSHAVVNGDLAPGSRTISVARDNDAVYFQIVGPVPAAVGDGWLVANELGDVPFAIMNLPGDRPAYGGLDMRAPDEKWLLKRGQTYWVRIGKFHKHGDKPQTVNARTAPIRVN